MDQYSKADKRLSMLVKFEQARPPLKILLNPVLAVLSLQLYLLSIISNHHPESEKNENPKQWTFANFACTHISMCGCMSANKERTMCISLVGVFQCTKVFKHIKDYSRMSVCLYVVRTTQPGRGWLAFRERKRKAQTRSRGPTSPQTSSYGNDDDAHHGWMGCPWGLQTITTAEAAPHSQQVFSSKITSLSFSAMMMNGSTHSQHKNRHLCLYHGCQSAAPWTFSALICTCSPF